MQRGHEHVLTFTGARLKDAEEVLFYDPGVTVKKVEVVDPQNVKVTVDVAPDCRLGEHIAQLRTKSGISDYRSFFVGALPGVDEKEPNNWFDQPQPIELNVCVAGIAAKRRCRLLSHPRQEGAADCPSRSKAFASARRISIRSWRFSIRIGSSWRSVDDTVLAKQDCFLSVIIPEDGDYTILVRETSYRGADNCRYRLHVGNFPRPTVAYPAGGKRGEQVKVQFLGDATGPIEREDHRAHRSEGRCRTCSSRTTRA